VRGLAADRFRAGALCFAAIGLTVWFRTLPRGLPALDDQAADLVRRELRARAAAALPPGTPEATRQSAIARRVTDTIGRDPHGFERSRAALAGQLRAERRLRAADGREHPYLGDYDSYLWLRHARRLLRTGTTCEVLSGGQCRDTLAHAPVGRQDAYAGSLHAIAIAAVHRVATIVNPGHPLSSSAFWVPVIAGSAVVLPAYGVASRLAGPVAGAVAALLVALNPSLLRRSLGGDNDVWNVLLPLVATWAIVEATAASRRRRQAALATLAGVVTALHATVWTGWVLGYGIALAGLCANVLFHALRALRTRTPWREPSVATGLVVGIVFLLSAEGTLRLVGRESPLPTAATRAQAAATVEWPTAFEIVGELEAPDVHRVVTDMGGPLYFSLAWLGYLLLPMPARGWTRTHIAVVAVGIALALHVFHDPELGRAAKLALMAGPFAAALAPAVRERLDGERSHPVAWFLLAGWFLGGLHLAGAGLRFLLVLALPYGVLAGFAVGRLFARASALGATVLPRHALACRILLVATILASLVPPLRWAYASARMHVPRMNDAWWDTLAGLRERTSPDTIVHAWWDYGYFVQYVAERRTSADGGSLRTHVPYWIARALLASDEREAVGLLRMLDCGSDATPLPEGARGAFGKLRAHGVDDLSSWAAIGRLATLDRDAARAHLAGLGLDDAEREDVLASTHCTPPPAVLLLGTHEIASLWRRLGSWDAGRAWVANEMRSLPEHDAVPAIARRLGLDEADARRLHRRASALRTGDEVEEFVAPRGGYASGRWHDCRREPSGDLDCPIGLATSTPGTRLDSFRYVRDAPEKSRLVFFAEEPTSETPAVILVADEGGIETIALPTPTRPEFSALVDRVGERVLLGAPHVLRSTFTRLVFFDGRYTTHFEKIDDRAVSGERIVAWKIGWP
jgi:hypothetical protein